MRKYRALLLIGAASILLAAGWIWAKTKLPGNKYFLVNNHFRSAKCELIDQSGQTLLSLPGNFCFLFDDGSYIMAVSAPELAGVYRFGADGNIIWHKEMAIHHDAILDRARKEFAVIGFRKVQHPKHADLTDEYILTMDLEGNDTFFWSTADHLRELEEISKKLSGKGLSLWPKDPLQPQPIFKYTHLNTVLPLPQTRIGEKDPRFKAGNILVNCWHTGLAFIIDRGTSQIVWAHHFALPVHSVRMDHEGTLYFFANRQESIPHKRSTVESMNPLTGERRLIFPRPDSGISMFTRIVGSLELAEDGTFLATSSLEGRAFEFDRDGNLLWTWSNPKLNSQNLPEVVYRLTPVASHQAEKILSGWKNF